MSQCYKKAFLFFCLQFYLIDNSGIRHMCERNFLHGFIHFFELFFKIFYFKHILREVGRKIVMEPVFSMGNRIYGIVMLLSFAIAYSFNVILMQNCKHSWNPNHHIHYRKRCVNHYTTGVAGGDPYNFKQKYRGENYCDQVTISIIFKDIIAILKALQGLGSTHFTPQTPKAKASQSHKMFGYFTPRCCSHMMQRPKQGTEKTEVGFKSWIWPCFNEI